MSDSSKLVATDAWAVAPWTKPSLYPEPYASMMSKRERRRLGDAFGLSNFGVNFTTIEPGGMSALRHHHALQDEFIYVLEGHPTLVTDAGDTELAPGMCAGFKAGNGDGHMLVNRGESRVVYLEVGDRTPGEAVVYPDVDMQGLFVDGAWVFSHRDGTPY
jgi:uncharacterized cupin superfamily protein